MPKASFLTFFHPAAGTPPKHRKVPLTQPLRHARYRRIWLANMVSNLGTWVQTFAAAWLVASLSQSASITSLVQTATYAPVFLFALLAGVLADAVHRPKFLFFCNLFNALCAGAVALLVWTGKVSVPLIVCGGMAWSTTVSTLSAAAQLSFPAEVRARTLPIYLFVMSGGYAAGSIFWGLVADA